MLKIPANRLDDIFAALANKNKLYLPLEKSGQVEFGQWKPGEKVRLDKLNTVKSAKHMFFPQVEDMVAFKLEKQNISIVEDREKVAPFVVFGVRACDAASFEILDKVFLADPVDTYYQARREKGTVVTLACGRPAETCFCTAFGIDPTEPKGDVETWLAGGSLFWNSRTQKGDALTAQLKDLLENADDADQKALAENKAEVKKILKKLPFTGLNPKELSEKPFKEVFDSPKWEQLSEGCLGCGACTFVCPTCQCFDIRDYDTGHGIRRYRCWDSCMCSDFTKMAAANPRTTKLQRFRQRFMHKLVYFPQKNDGVFSCVGCGRCVAKCPVSMNIVKVIKTFADKA